MQIIWVTMQGNCSDSICLTGTRARPTKKGETSGFCCVNECVGAAQGAPARAVHGHPPRHRRCQVGQGAVRTAWAASSCPSKTNCMSSVRSFQLSIQLGVHAALGPGDYVPGLVRGLHLPVSHMEKQNSRRYPTIWRTSRGRTPSSWSRPVHTIPSICTSFFI
mmetsp:Transcript_7674/g.10868  ORF Transcript_7674/g.10868 Transcript_7674/m.10868 type:complete len:163 (+) Transcript_7674:44-532(+)